MSIETAVDRETLRYAVSRSISYPFCGHIADVRDAALLTTESGAGLVHEKCANVDGLAAVLEADPAVGAFEILRGSVLFA